MSIAAALMWENTWLPWPRCPKWFKAPIPAVFGLPGAAAGAAPRAGTGTTAAPLPSAVALLRALPAGWAGLEGTGDAPRGSERSRERRSGSSEVPTPCPIGWEYLCLRIRSLLKFVIDLLLLPTQKTVKMQIFVEAKFCVVWERTFSVI